MQSPLYKDYDQRRKEFDRSVRRTQMAATAVGCVLFGIYAAGVLLVGYVVWHFISKFW